MTAPKPKTGGQPSKILDLVVAVDTETGKERSMPAWEHLVQLVELGVGTERASRAAGVAPATMHNWIDTAARVARQLATDPDADISPTDRACFDFQQALTAAEARFETTLLAVLRRLAEGALTTETIVEKYERDPDSDQLVMFARQVTRRKMVPSQAAATWLLERKFPDRYLAARLAEAAPADVTPDLTDAAVASLLDDVSAYLADQ